MYVVRGVARHGDAALFDRMLILAVTSARTDVPPSIILDQLYEIADFHLIPGLSLSLRPIIPPLPASAVASYSNCGSAGADSWDAAPAAARLRCRCPALVRKRSR